MILSEIRLAHPDWKIVPGTDDMELIVNCASCGKKILFGQTYTAFEQTTDDGAFGLPVCSECYQPQIDRRYRNGGSNNGR